MNIRLPENPKHMVTVNLLQELLFACLSQSIPSVVAGLALVVLIMTARRPQQ